MDTTDPAPPRAPLRRPWWRWPLMAVWLVFAAAFGGAIGLVLSGRALPAPQWAIAQIEERLNAQIQSSLPEMSVHIQDIGLTFGSGLAPTLVLSGAQLRSPEGAAVIALPMAEVALAWQGLLEGKARLQDLRLSGANLSVTRDTQGRLDIALATGASLDLGQVFALSDRFFAGPLGQGLRRLSMENLRLTLHDLRLDRSWALRDGALTITQSASVLTADLGLSLAASVGGQQAAGLGRVDIRATSALGGQSADISARLSGISAQDLAAQAPALAFISVLDAPLSGEVAAQITPQGLGALQAQLTLGAGEISPFAPASDPAPNAAPQPILFQSAQIDLGYDPATGRITLKDLGVKSQALNLRATGHADALRDDGSVIAGGHLGEWPAAFAAQLTLQTLRLDRPDMFDAPLDIAKGEADFVLRLAPFAVELTHAQLRLGALAAQDAGALAAQGAGALTATGGLRALPSGWQSQLDVSAPAITVQHLLALWPKPWLRGTREWVAANVTASRLTDVAIKLRQAAGARMQMDLGYHFDGMTMTPMRSLPPIRGGAGYGAISGGSFSMVLRQGRITPPQGGDLNLAGSVFSIPNIAIFPATGKLTLQSSGALTAALSLIDQPPFGYMAKSGRAVDFARGAARLTTHITLPLQRVITLPDITLQMSGEITDFSSDQVAAGRVVAAAKLDVFVTKEQMQISGAGDISGAAFDAVYRQPFGPNQPPQVTGRAPLSGEVLRRFGVQLPQGMVSGQTSADFTLTLPRGQAAQLALTSDLRGLDLSIGAVGYRKPSDLAGAFRAEIALSSPPQITQLAIRAGDLSATGRIRLGPNAALAEATFPDTAIGKWFAGEVVLTGQGGGALALSVPRGTLDLRFLPPIRSGGGEGNALPLSLRLERLRVSNGITLTDFQGDFASQLGGLRGNFAARVAAGAPIQGQLAPSAHGTQIRITAQDAGAALAQAGVYGAARGGAMDLVLTPQSAAGHYMGDVQMAGVRVIASSILAELLNAISVIGLLDQLSGTGILFNTVSGQFLLTPQGVELREGVATGGSLGVTMQGAYQFEGGQVQMQGVISPIYLINGVGAVVSKRGEGVLGFNYQLRGTADAPDVRVNPLSVLLPGFLRNLFKTPPATLNRPAP